MTEIYINKTDQFIDLKKLPIDSNDNIQIILNSCNVILDEQGLNRIKGINSLEIKSSKIYTLEQIWNKLYSGEQLPKLIFLGNHVEIMDKRSKL